MRIGQVSPVELQRLLRRGLCLDYGAATVRLKSSAQALAPQLGSVYASFDLQEELAFADLHVRVDPVPGLRRWLRPQIVFTSDGRQEFHPFPADTALPLFEWGVNWLVGQRMHHRLVLHAGALERDGFGLLLPATPGSGKSTLSAALSLRGWRLLSDEFGVCDPGALTMHALLKPVALKNRSIDVIRGFCPGAPIGPVFPKTRKGDVAHLAPGLEAVRRRHEPAVPAAIVLPRWHEGAATALRRIDDDATFRALAFNAFNYGALGETGFRTVVGLMRRCSGWQLVYSDLDDAIASIDRWWPQAMDEALRRQARTDPISRDMADERGPAVHE